MAQFNIKQNDTSPAIKVQLVDDDGNAIDLTNASVDFHMVYSADGSVKVDSAANITDASNGKVEYKWVSGDTDTTGSYDAEFQVTYADSSVETFPNDSNISVEISPELA